MSYVDGFVVPVPKSKLDAYKKMAETAKKVWLKYGALDYVEAVADDVKWGKTTSFPRSVKRKSGETVVFAYIKYKSRAHRDSVIKKVMKDPVLANCCDPKNLPFDGWRMIFGGFKVIVSK